LILALFVESFRSHAKRASKFPELTATKMRNDLCRQHGVCHRATTGWLAILSFTATSGRITQPPPSSIQNGEALHCKR